MVLRFFLHFFLISLFAFVHSEEQWQVEEKEIFLAAEQENLPVVAVFLGGNWCPWSQLLRRDLLHSPLFIEKIGKDAILWEIVLEKEPQDHAMRQKYRIEECPQILLLDPKGKEFARLPIASMSASEYGDEIIHLIDGFQRMCFSLEQKLDIFDELYWKDLYLIAKKLSVPCYKQVILEMGLTHEQGNFFHLEKFESMLLKHKLKSPQIQKMKRELLARDPENLLGTHYKIAVLEFNKCIAGLKPKDRYEKALKPLLQYVHRFGNKDPENLWRAEWMIAEFLFAKHSFPLALEHAEASYHAAPESIKPKMSETLSFIKRKS